MFALGIFHDLTQLLAPYVGSALLSLFLSLAGTILLVGIVGLLVFLAVIYFVFRSPDDQAIATAQRKRDALRTRILDRPIPTGKRLMFLDGIRAPLDGFRFMNAYPWRQCWRYAVTPAICNLVISAIVIAAVVTTIATFAGTVHGWFQPAFWSRVLEFVTCAILLLIVVGIGFGSWLFLQNVVCGYFFSKLTLRVEHLLGTDPGHLSDQSMMTEIKDAGSDAAALMTVQAGLLAANLFPGVGSILSAIGGFYFGSLFAGTEFQSYPMTARAIPRSERKQFAKNHRWHVLGLGTTTLGLVLLPGVGAMLLATATVGGVLQYHRLTRNIPG